MKSKSSGKISAKWVPIFSICFFFFGLMFTNKYVYCKNFTFPEFGAAKFTINKSEIHFQNLGSIGIKQPVNNSEKKGPRVADRVRGLQCWKKGPIFTN